MIVDSPPQGLLFVLSRQERQALLQDTSAVPPHILLKIETAPWQGENVRVWLDLDELEALLQGLATEADRAASRRREELFFDLYARLLTSFGRAVGLESLTLDKTLLQELSRGFMRVLEQPEFDPQSASEALAHLIDEHNRRPLPELGGLSPHQAFLLHNCGWWADPFPIRLVQNLSFEQVGQTPFFHNVRAFLQAVEEWEGAPTTTTGNLTRAFVGHMLDLLRLRPGRLEMIREVCKVINEPDVWQLHIVRVICQIGGLVRKYKKRFVITRKARGLLQADRAGALYGHLFDTMFRRFNLAYLTRVDEVPGIQETIPYELYRIAQLPLGQAQEIEDLVSVVLVPAVHEEIAEHASLVDTPEWLLKNFLLRPLEGFGLVEIVAGKHKPPSVDLMNRVRRLPLFDAFLRFEL
jgi:hypothetical protein